MSTTRETYQQLIYTITELSEHIRYSDLVMIPYGKNIYVVKGNIIFDESIRLEIREVLDFTIDDWIKDYCYTVYRENTRTYWYDSQSYPDDPDLQSTHPHHKHIPPNIKHHRIPAPNLSFKEQNLTFLVREIEEQFF
jgi:hypothetical protein